MFVDRKDNKAAITIVIMNMNQERSYLDPNEGRDNDLRLLRRLRMTLLVLLLSFIVTVIWFTNSPAF